ncbi:MAG: glycosyltransferase [Psychroserpens sp.]|uniref:glycosyltransferase n=1 Tax=Psychroserpens sp. TaxID=2020870 RepID=UPI0030017A78
MEPKISIIVPVYNVEKYLHRCIDSIINQSYKNLEIILINDGSLDSSGEICDYYSNMDLRVLVIHQENKGLSGARNSGLKIASGNYIGFVDSDDWIEPDMYKTMLNILEKHDVDIVECDLLSTTEVNNGIDRSGSLVMEDRLQALKRIIKNQDFSVCSRLYHKKLLQEISFVEGKNSEDVYFTFDLFKNINNSIYLSNMFYNYYIAGDSITRGKYKLKVLDSVDAALHLKNKVYHEENDKELKEIARNFLLDVLLYNYKMLHYNSTFDSTLNHRKKIKNLINENYNKNNNSPLHLRLARFLPINIFNLFVKLNSLLIYKQR